MYVLEQCLVRECRYAMVRQGSREEIVGYRRRKRIDGHLQTAYAQIM